VYRQPFFGAKYRSLIQDERTEKMHDKISRLTMLNEYVHNQPGHLIRRAHQIAWSKFSELTNDQGLTPVQYSILVAILEFPALDATRLRELVMIDRATIGNIIQRLETKGLLIRKPDAMDRRAKHIYITDSGRQLVEQVNSVRHAIADSLLSPFSETERKTFMRLIRKLVKIDDVIAKTLLIAATLPSNETKS
jgi:DNA-binding MarR family transcriptional regulator